MRVELGDHGYGVAERGSHILEARTVPNHLNGESVAEFVTRGSGESR